MLWWAKRDFTPRKLGNLQLWLDATQINPQGYSLDFDGTDDFVQANNVITAYPFTLECWVRLDVTNADQRIMAIAQTSTTDKRFGFSFGNGAQRFGIAAQNTTLIAEFGTTAPSANTWYHVAAVFVSATDRKLYLNGVLEATTPSGSVTFNNSANNRVEMGRHFDNNANNLNGKLSDVRVWNTARTAQEIADNYQKRLIGNESGLVGYWKLDKGSGTTVTDFTSNANAGTISGAIWDNSEPLTEAISDNTAVRVWADQSGKGYDATQSTSAARPTYIASGLNGLPVVRFDGTDDRLTIPSSTATFKFLHSDVSTVFMVMKAGVVADPNALYLVFGNGGANGTNVGYEIWWDDRVSVSSNNAISNRIYRGVSGGNAAGQLIQNIFPANTFGIMTVIGDPANATAIERLTLIVNGGNTNKGNSVTNALSTSNATNDLTIGNVSNTGGSLNGDIAEVIIYNRALTSRELSEVHAYLSKKWGIRLA